MPTVPAGPITPIYVAPPSVAVVLGTAQTGNGDTTDTLDRGGADGPGVVKLTTTIGATPTCTFDIQGSIDGVTWWNVPYALTATPTTFVVTAITITTAVTNHYLLQTGQPWRYLKVARSANTNVTVTTTAWVTGRR